MDKRLQPKRKGVNYAKWGYIFILPFFVTYIIFTLTPQIMTIYNSFFENYRSGLLWSLFMSAPEIRPGLEKLGFYYKTN